MGAIIGLLLANAFDEQAANHVQANVYFGYLRGIVGSSFQVTDFVRDGRFITIARLRGFFPGIASEQQGGLNWLRRPKGDAALNSFSQQTTDTTLPLSLASIGD